VERAAGATAPAPGEDPAGAPVSLNSATAEQLDQLDGVGPATAQKILDWRKEHGGFGSLEDLKRISGIGPKRFDALKDRCGCEAVSTADELRRNDSGAAS